MLRLFIPSFAKHIVKQIILGIPKLNRRKDLVLRDFVYDMTLPSKQLSFQI